MQYGEVYWNALNAVKAMLSGNISRLRDGLNADETCCHMTFNQGAAGSIPARPTNRINNLRIFMNQRNPERQHCVNTDAQGADGAGPNRASAAASSRAMSPAARSSVNSSAPLCSVGPS